MIRGQRFLIILSGSETRGKLPTENLRASLRDPAMNTLESAEILIIWGETFPGVARLEAWQNTQDAYAPRKAVIRAPIFNAFALYLCPCGAG